MKNMKTCTQCGEMKPLEEYYMRYEKGKKPRRRANCIKCVKKVQLAYRESRRQEAIEYQREYRSDPNNQEKMKKARQIHREKNKEKIAIANKEWRLKNREALKAKAKEYRFKNLEKIKKYQKQYKAVEEHRQKAIVYAANYREVHEDRIRANQKEYYLKNHEALKTKAKEYRLKNKEKTKESMAKWVKLNREHVREQAHINYINNREERKKYSRNNYQRKKEAQPGCIYKIVNMKNHCVYVGQTTRGELRWKDHLSDLRGNYHSNSKLQRDYNEFGEHVFEWRIIKEMPKDEKTLLLAEARTIQKYLEEGKELYNYNLTIDQLKMLLEK